MIAFNDRGVDPNRNFFEVTKARANNASVPARPRRDQRVGSSFIVKQHFEVFANIRDGFESNGFAIFLAEAFDDGCAWSADFMRGG